MYKYQCKLIQYSVGEDEINTKTDLYSLEFTSADKIEIKTIANKFLIFYFGDMESAAGTLESITDYEYFDGKHIFEWEADDGECYELTELVIIETVI